MFVCMVVCSFVCLLALLGSEVITIGAQTSRPCAQGGISVKRPNKNTFRCSYIATQYKVYIYSLQCIACLFPCLFACLFIHVVV